MTNTNANVVATYTDRYGVERVIHHTRHGLQVRRETKTVALKMNQVIARMIGQQIKHYRIQQGLTLEELCVKSGLASATPKSRMWEIENATRKEGLRMGTLYAIAHALGVEAAQLLPCVDAVLEGADLHSVETTVLAAKS